MSLPKGGRALRSSTQWWVSLTFSLQITTSRKLLFSKPQAQQNLRLFIICTGLSEGWLLPTSIHTNCSSIWDSLPGIWLWTWPFLSSCHYLKPVSQPVPTRRTAWTLTSPAPFQFPRWGWLGPSWSLSLPWFLERLGLCLHPGRGQLRPSPLLHL